MNSNSYKRAKMNINNNTYYVFFSKLSNPLRTDIISCLQKGEKTVSELGSEIGVEQSKLSHALKELKQCHIVNSKAKGKMRVYTLSPTIIPILKAIDIHSSKCCDGKCKTCMFSHQN